MDQDAIKSSIERAKHTLENRLISWGFKIAGYCEKSKPGNAVVSSKLLWIDID